MKKGRLLILAVIIGLVCSGYFIFNERQASNYASAILTEPVLYEEVIFPAPGKTLYQMGLYLDHTNRIIYGSTVLDTVNTTPNSLTELWFTTYPNAFKTRANTPAPLSAYVNGFNEGWLNIEEIKVNGEIVEYTDKGVSTQVILNTDIYSGKEIRIEMRWQAKVPSLAYRYGTKDGVFMLGNFYPTLNVLSNDGWHISYNSVFGDPFCFHIADYIVRLNVHESYDVVSTGVNMGRIAEDNGRESYIIKAKNVRDFCLVVMHSFEAIEKHQNGVLIQTFYPKGHKVRGQEILKQSADILNFFSCTLGSYPYDEFKVVFVPMKGFHGMEYSGLIFLREEFLLPNYDRARSDFILAHEIAHQWWYAIVGNDQIKEPWLDEGLANWSAYKYLNYAQGRTPPSYQNFSKGIKLDRELNEIYSTQEYYLTAYNGGEAFWFGLEKKLGSDTVVKVLRRYLADYKYKIATTKDLLEIIQLEAGEDLELYFSKWFSFID